MKRHHYADEKKSFWEEYGFRIMCLLAIVLLIAMMGLMLWRVFGR